MTKAMDAKVLDIAAQMFSHGQFQFDTHLTDEQLEALQTLKKIRATIDGPRDREVVMCHYCGLHAGYIFRDEEGMKVQCPDCGPTWLNERSLNNCKIDDGWVIRKIRAALNMDGGASAKEVMEGVWDLGKYQRRPVILARTIRQVMSRGLSIFHGSTPRPNAWVITPKGWERETFDPLDGVGTWLKLEDSFAFQGGGFRFLERDDDDSARTLEDAPTAPVHGPFSADFQWAYMDDWPHGPIRLTAAQSKLFGALWELRASPSDSPQIMRRAGLNSQRPSEVIKVRSGGSGNPEFEGPRFVYEKLVQRNKRLGLYRLSWPVEPANVVD